MQVGTGYFFDSRNRQMTALNGAAQRLQTQLATGKKLLAPSDDPVATGRLARMSIVVGGRTTPSSRQSSWR